MDMRQEKVSTLTEILAQKGPLADLCERSRLITQLDTLLGFYLDSRLRQFIRVAAYQKGTLILACANSTVAGQCRYLSRIYLQQLRQHSEFYDIKHIHPVIAPLFAENHTQKTTPPRLRKLSPATARLLTSFSSELGNGEVSQALRQLARHVEITGTEDAPPSAFKK
jgi:hypothetical protein